MHVHFCQTCGTKLYLTFERFAGACGVYAGTFDEPDWFAIGADNAKHIYLDVARHDTVLPAGINVFRQHATLNDGTPLEPVVFDVPHVVGRRAEGVESLMHSIAGNPAMLLVIDCGNTNVVFAVRDGEAWRGIWRVRTDAQRTSDEYGVWLMIAARAQRP